jgi:hypothetical protein
VLLVWPGVGALLGVGGAVVVRDGPWWAAALVHYATPSVLLIALIGAFAPRPGAAAFRASACFVAFVIAYYAVVALQFGSIPVLYASALLAAAVTVCPVGAAVVRWARDRRGPVPGAVFAAGGAAALSDGSVGNLVRVAAGRLDPGGIQPVLLVTGAVGLAVAGLVALLLPRQRRTRLVAAVLLLPFAVVATYVGWIAHFGVGPYL